MLLANTRYGLFGYVAVSLRACERKMLSDSLFIEINTPFFRALYRQLDGLCCEFCV